MEGYLGTIIMFGGNYAPRDWALCQGQLLAISEYSALYSILGTNFGGDGRINFGVPDLRGRAPVGVGTGPGLSPRALLGQKGGAETATLSVANLPSHSHTAKLHGETSLANSKNPEGNMLATPTEATKTYAAPVAADNKVMSSESIVVENTGSGQAFNIQRPYQVVNFIICTNGLYPSRN